MIPTKTYPLSAIMGEEMTDKERIAELQNAFEDAVTRAEKAENRIAELADAFNRVCAENVDFVAESIRDEARIVALEAEVKMLRKDAERYWCLRDNCNFAITQNIGHDWINLIFADEIDAAIDAAREGK